jgi:hypothetical protein
MDFFKTLYDTAHQKFAGGDSEVPLNDWITQYTTHRRRPFSYNRFPFQERIAGDDHPHLTVVKCSQIGLTEIQIRKFFAMLRRNNGISGIFSLPNEDMRKRVYTTRMAPVLQADEIFNPSMGEKPVRRQDLIQIGDSFGYITGCTEGEATSIPADLLFHDELDLSPQDIIGLYQSRLQGSDMKITQSFSTPTFMGYGVDREYGLSDQHQYLVRCGGCNHWQFPIFDHRFIHVPKLDLEIEKLTDLTAEQIADLDLSEAVVKCEKCNKPLDLADSSKREWVALLPTRSQMRGYKVNPFSTDRLSLDYIFHQLSQYKEKENLKGFYNTVLGEPFTESSAQIQKHEIDKCFADSPNIPDISKDMGVYMGIDMGQMCHIVLLGDTTEEGKEPFVLFDIVNIHQLSERIADLRKVYSIVQGCVDRYPYTPTVDTYRDTTNGLIMPIHFGGNAIIMPKADEGKNVIYYTANRTVSLDRVRTVVVNQDAVLAGYGPYRETIVTHMRDLVRDESPEKEPEWKKLNGNDHFFFAMAYAMLAKRVSNHMFAHKFEGAKTVLTLFGSNFGKNEVEDITPNIGARKYSGFTR